MTSPSIKEALELAIKFIESHMHYSQPAPDMGEEPSDMFTNEALPVVVGLNIALATFQPDGERREAIAPLRNRLADLIHQNYEPPPEGFPETEPWNGGALDIVDMIIEEILVSGLVQNEAAIRRDEREKCAKIADDLLLSRDAEWWRNSTKMEVCSEVCQSAAAAIRYARDGGEA